MDKQHQSHMGPPANEAWV